MSADMAAVIIFLGLIVYTMMVFALGYITGNEKPPENIAQEDLELIKQYKNISPQMQTAVREIIRVTQQK